MSLFVISFSHSRYLVPYILQYAKPAETRHPPSLQLDPRRGRYRLDGDSLQIVGVQPADSGEYTCSADNYRAEPDSRVITLNVTGNSGSTALGHIKYRLGCGILPLTPWCFH